jgi:hypothetical protein
MIQNIKAYPNYPANCEHAMESTTYRLTILNNSKISDIKVFLNIDNRENVFTDASMRTEVDHVRIKAGQPYTFNSPIDYVIVGSCTGGDCKCYINNQFICC